MVALGSAPVWTAPGLKHHPGSQKRIITKRQVKQDFGLATRPKIYLPSSLVCPVTRVARAARAAQLSQNMLPMVGRPGFLGWHSSDPGQLVVDWQTGSGGLVLVSALVAATHHCAGHQLVRVGRCLRRRPGLHSVLAQP